MADEPGVLADAPAAGAGTMAPRTRLRLEQVSHQFGSNFVLDDITLDIWNKFVRLSVMSGMTS